MYSLPEHCVDYLGSSKPSMSTKISSWLIVVITLWPKVSSVLGNYLCLPISLLLILFNPFILINPLADAHFGQASSQGLPQIMLSKQADLKCPYCYIIKIFIYLIKHLLVPI